MTTKILLNNTNILFSVRVSFLCVSVLCITTLGGCRSIQAAADPMSAEDCRVFVPGAGNGQVVVVGLDAYAVSLGFRRHLARLDGSRLLFDTPLGARETGSFDGRSVVVRAGLTRVSSGPIEGGGLVLSGTRYRKKFLYNEICSPGQAAVGAFALFELSRRRQKY